MARLPRGRARPSALVLLGAVALAGAGATGVFARTSCVASPPPLTRAPLEPGRGDVASLLRSPDARLQAWGAWYAGQGLLVDMVPLVRRVVTANLTPGSERAEIALDIALDALIQLGGTVSSDASLTLYERRPAQALALLGRSGPVAEEALMTLVRYETALPWFAAANLLLPKRFPGLASAILQDTHIELTVTVSENGDIGVGHGGGFGVSHGNCPGGGFGDEFPPRAHYELTTHPVPGVVVLTTGPTSVYYRRQMTRGRSSSPPPTGGGPTTNDRLQYAGALIGIDRVNLPIHAQEHRSVIWRGRAELDAEISRFRGEVLGQFEALLRLLVGHGVMSQAEANSVPAPRVSVRVYDGRSLRSAPLRSVPPAFR